MKWAAKFSLSSIGEQPFHLSTDPDSGNQTDVRFDEEIA